MIGNVGLPGWFIATGLRVSLKQPNSRGIPGSFGAIFSDVNRLDVCPVGYYNRRMTFLRGTRVPGFWYPVCESTLECRSRCAWPWSTTCQVSSWN